MSRPESCALAASADACRSGRANPIGGRPGVIERARARLQPLAALVGLASALTAAPAARAQHEDVTVRRGVAPVVVTIPHAGKRLHDRKDVRACTAEHDVVCASGPCRTTFDRYLDALGPAFAAHLGACLGAPPSVVQLEAHRKLVDVGRDPDDAGGVTCALADAGQDRATWDAFYAAVDAEVARARAQAGDRALLIDVHTYGNNASAPPPAIILGAGRPFGATVPRLARDDGALASVFGPTGARARLLTAFAHVDRAAEVFPLAPTDIDDELFAGRHLLKRMSATVDALQLEISAGLRDDPELAAFLAADALCAALAPRVMGADGRDADTGAP